MAAKTKLVNKDANFLDRDGKIQKETTISNSNVSGPIMRMTLVNISFIT